MTTERFREGERVIERWDRVFRVLTAEPRRQLITTLLDAGAERPVPLPEAAMSPTVPRERETLRFHLHHRHLPMLAEAGFVRWEREPLRAWRGPNFEEAAVVIASLHECADELPDRLVHGCHRLEAERAAGER